MSKFQATSNNGYIVTSLQNQDAGQGDWVKYKVNTKDKSNLTIDSSTTATSLVTPDEVKKYQKIGLYNSTDGFKIIEALNITYDSGTGLYTIDISSAGLTVAPTIAHSLLKTKDLTIDDNSTTTSNLAVLQHLTDNEIIKGNEDLVVYNSTDGYKKQDNITISNKSLQDTTGTHDIFGDGSAIATYQFNGNANDLGGNYNGTAYGSPSYTTGYFGQCIDLDGTDDYVDTGYTHQGSQVSVSWWAKLDDVSSSEVFFSDINSSGSGSSIRIFLGINYNSVTGKFYFIIGDGTSSWSDSSVDHNLQTNRWYHFVLIIDGTSVKLYQNGQLVTNLTSTVSLTNGTQTIKIGRDGDLSSSYLNGLIDQFRIFNRALTENEIQTLYIEKLIKYSIDISSLSLTIAPTSAYIIKPRVEIGIGTNDNEANVDDIVLDVDIVNTTTSTIVTNYMDLNESQRYRIKNAKRIDTDTNVNVVPSSITEEGDGGTPEKYKYTINIPTQSSAPTKAVIRPHDIDYPNVDLANTTYDNVNDIVQVQYSETNKDPNTFRSIQAKWNAQKINDENSKIQIDLWRLSA